MEFPYRCPIQADLQRRRLGIESRVDGVCQAESSFFRHQLMRKREVNRRVEVRPPHFNRAHDPHLFEADDLTIALFTLRRPFARDSLVRMSLVIYRLSSGV